MGRGVPRSAAFLTLSEAVLLEILPLGLGAAVSPLVVAGEIYCISEPAAGLRRGWLFAAGNALVVGIWLAIGLAMGHALPTRPDGADAISVALRLAMGLVMLVLGIQLLLHPPRGATAPNGPGPKRPDLRAFALGVGVMAQNMSSLVLFFPAVADITRAGGAEAMPLIVLVLLTLSPCLVPPLLVSLGGQGGRTLLDRFNRWLKPKQWALGLVVFFGMAAYLLISGIQAL
jgi:threonine/homoserine/homoserine lactone efflux protein